MTAHALYVVTWPNCGADFQIHATLVDARMAADFVARIFGEATIHENNGRTTPRERITRADIRAAEARAA